MLIESALGKIALNRIREGEHDVIRDESGDLRQKILLLQSAINDAPPERRNAPEVIESLKKIMSSVEITCAPELLVFLARKYPRMMMELAEEQRMSKRIQHLYRIAEIGRLFSPQILARLNKSIDEVRREAFELVNRE